MGNVKIFCPQYYAKFECIGDRCRNNCCHDWIILIDKAAYDKYFSLDGELREEFAQKTEIIQEDPFRARFCLDEDGKCKFLSEKGLCTIQLRLGHEALCHTCRSYPRITNSLAVGEAEAFLTMSCEAAVNAALFSSDIMRLGDSKLSFDEHPTYSNGLHPEKYTDAPDGAELFWKLRITSVFILQNRKYKLWERMVILGLFIKAADELLAEKKHSELGSLANEFIERVDSDYYDDLIKQLPNRYDLKLGFIMSILGSPEIARKKSLGKYIEQVKEGLEIGPDNQYSEELAVRFSEIHQRYYQSFFSGKEYILENYVVNLVFMSGFPFNYKEEGGIMNNYLDLATKYSLIKFMLVGMSGYHRMGFDKRKVVEGISAFSRLFEHNTTVMKNTIEYLESNNANTVGALSMLLKD